MRISMYTCVRKKKLTDNLKVLAVTFPELFANEIGVYHVSQLFPTICKAFRPRSDLKKVFPIYYFYEKLKK